MLGMSSHKYQDPGSEIRLEVREKEILLIFAANGNSKEIRIIY